jgi:hypothetical protein
MALIDGLTMVARHTEVHENSAVAAMNFMGLAQNAHITKRAQIKQRPDIGCHHSEDHQAAIKHENFCLPCWTLLNVWKSTNDHPESKSQTFPMLLLTLSIMMN